MPVNNGIITAPVSTDDVGSCLGCSSHDVKTLCRYDSINPWAKYKPEAFGGPGELTLDQRKENGFGLRPGTVYKSKQLLINAVRDENFDHKWKYNKVGENDWGRLTDFVGYNHQATPPFGTLIPSTFYLSKSSSNKLVIPMSLPRFESTTGNDNGELSLKDFAFEGASDADGNSINFSEWYVGLLLYDDTNLKNHMLVTKSKKIKDDSDWQIDFGHVDPGNAGLYIGVPVLSDKIFTNGGSDPANANIISAGSPGVEIQLATSVSQYPMGIAVGYTSAGGKRVKYSVSIKNLSTSSITITSVTLSAAKTNTGTSSQTIKAFGNVTVAAGAIWSADGEYDLPDSAYGYARITTGTSSVDNSNWVGFTMAFQPIQTIK